MKNGSNIRKEAGYPVGSGVAIHASAAKYVSKWDMICPSGMTGIDDKQWMAAVSGRLLGLQLRRPEMTSPFFLIGVNQHVAKDDNAALREMLLQTLAHMNALALACGGRFALVGDMNAAPEGGRWGYSSRSKTRAADLLTTDWASTLGSNPKDLSVACLSASLCKRTPVAGLSQFERSSASMF